MTSIRRDTSSEIRETLTERRQRTHTQIEDEELERKLTQTDTKPREKRLIHAF